MHTLLCEEIKNEAANVQAAASLAAAAAAQSSSSSLTTSTTAKDEAEAKEEEKEVAMCNVDACGRPAGSPRIRFKGYCAVHFRELFSIPLDATEKNTATGSSTVDSVQIISLGLPKLEFDLGSLFGLVAHIGNAFVHARSLPAWEAQLLTRAEQCGMYVDVIIRLSCCSPFNCEFLFIK